VDHLALAVRDPERSARFYATYFGFDRGRRWYDDGKVLFVYDAEDFALALGPWNDPVQLPAFLHFGTGLTSPDAVRALRDCLAADGVELVEWWDEPDYVSVKCRDPDGYVVEASWEPPRPREPGR
jgi:catechol 2,3-dioxygenase-like lactoylglutathione lyase family enzyme